MQPRPFHGDLPAEEPLPAKRDSSGSRDEDDSPLVPRLVRSEGLKRSGRGIDPPIDRAPSPPLLPALLMGIGFGGFLDGIVLHQILQWHHMLSSEGCCPSSTVPGLEDNTLADGLFHVATWIALFAGTITAVSAWQRGVLAPPWRSHFGGLFLGFGLFNLVEGVIDHHVLGLHHVRDDLGAPLEWDLGFLAIGGVLFIAVGTALIRSGRREVTRRNFRASAPGPA